MCIRDSLRVLDHEEVVPAGSLVAVAALGHPVGSLAVDDDAVGYLVRSLARADDSRPARSSPVAPC